MLGLHYGYATAKLRLQYGYGYATAISYGYAANTLRPRYSCTMAMLPLLSGYAPAICSSYIPATLQLRSSYTPATLRLRSGYAPATMAALRLLWLRYGCAMASPRLR